MSVTKIILAIFLMIVFVICSYIMLYERSILSKEIYLYIFITIWGVSVIIGGVLITQIVVELIRQIYRQLWRKK